MIRIFTVVAALTCSLALAQTVPGSISFNARLTDSAGAPVAGSHALGFGLYDQASAGAAVWTENVAGASFSTEGLVYAELGAVTALTASALDGRKLYLEVSVDGTTMSPRLAVVSVPYAIRASVAATAVTVGSLTESAIQRRVTGTCPAGQALRSVDANGGVQCEPIPAGLMSCASGEVLKSNGSGWVCAADIGIAGVTVGSGLSGGGTSGTVSVGLISCASGQVLSSSGSGWACATPASFTGTFTGNTTLTGDLTVVGARAGQVNVDPTAAQLTNSGLILGTPGAIVDNILTNTAWHTDTSPINSWLMMDLGAGGDREYVRARIYAASPGYAGRYDVQFSDNGSAWSTVRAGFVPSELGSNEVSWSPAGAHRYWRFLLVNVPGGGPWLSELEMFAVTSGNALSVDTNGALKATSVEAINTPKAWVSFNGATMLVKDSYGVASITRAAGNPAGVYKITWARPFSNTGYVVTGMCNALGYSGAQLTIEEAPTGDTVFGTAAMAVGCRNTANAYVDSNLVHVIAFGR